MYTVQIFRARVYKASVTTIAEIYENYQLIHAHSVVMARSNLTRVVKLP